MDLERLIIFSILMANGKGILVKSPGYVEKKFNSVMTAPYPEQLLDWDNIEKYKKYLKDWEAHLRSR